MNQLKRILMMNPLRVLKKICCFEEVYTIAYRRREGRTLLDSDLLDFERIPYDDTFWYADPILTTWQGETYLLMERFDMRTQVGSIACARFGEDGKPEKPRLIIQEPYHMSFPMVFSWNGELYMIPETSENHSLNLYRCQGDLYHWTLVESFHTEAELVDTAVISCREDRVELLCSEITDDVWFQYKWQKLSLVREKNGFRLEEDAAFNASARYRYADRMAGSLIREGNTVILPTQGSTETEYGIDLYLNDFSQGNISDLPVLKKVTVDNIRLPDVARKEQIGVHSYALTEQYEVVDMRYFRFSPRNRLRKLLSKFRR